MLTALTYLVPPAAAVAYWRWIEPYLRSLPQSMVQELVSEAKEVEAEPPVFRDLDLRWLSGPLAALLALVAWRFSSSPAEVAAHLVFTTLLVLLARVDATSQILPDRITFPLLWLGLLASAVGLTPVLPGGAITAAAMLGGGTWLLGRIGGGFGGGDAPLVAALGAWLGLIGGMLSVLVAGVITIVAVLCRKKLNGANLSSPMAFGPSLAAGGYLLQFPEVHRLLLSLF